MRLFQFLAAFTIIALLLIDASEAGFCSAPTEPSCVDMLDSSGTSDTFEFDQCRSELESYQDDLK